MEKTRRLYKNMSLRKRLLITFILLISIPMIVFGFRFYLLSKEVMEDSAQKNAYQIVKKNNEIIDTKLGQINEKILSFIGDDALYSIFSDIRPTSDYNINLMDIHVSKLLNKYFGYSNDIYSVQVATSYFTFIKRPEKVTTTKNYIPKGVFKDTELYRTAFEGDGRILWVPTYEFSDMFHVNYLKKSNLEYKYLFSVIQMMNRTYFDGRSFLSFPSDVERPVLIINLKEGFYHSVFKDSIPIDGSYYFVVTKDGKVVSHQEQSKLATTLDIPWLKEIAQKGSGTDIVEFEGKKMIICYDTSKVTDWVSVVLIPYDRLLDKIMPTISRYMVALMIILIFISLLISYFISGMITKPILKLTKAIRKTGQGKFDSRVDEIGSIEFRELIVKFNDMNEKIQNLIKENFEKEIKEKEAEILVLNLQLDPHFMYNTLNLINLMLIENGQDEVSELIDNLSNMLKYTVRNKKGLVTFKEDLLFLKSYISIMTKRFEGKYQVEYIIDERLYEYEVPKFFMQPYVENSFVHAFNVLKTNGLLKITGWIDGDLRYYSIEDNGSGIELEKLTEINTNNSASIGINNVNNRIKLVYGNDYGVHIESVLGLGTKIIICLPLNDNN